MTQTLVTEQFTRMTGWGAAPVRACSCAICSSSVERAADNPHVMAAAMEGENRGAERIAQYKDADGFYNFSGDATSTRC